MSESGVFWDKLKPILAQNNKNPKKVWTFLVYFYNNKNN